MTNLSVRSSALSGTIRIPSSKSHTMRACLFALMAEGTSYIRNYLNSPDTDAMLLAIELLGAKINKEKDCIEITGVNRELRAAENVIDAKNSGQVMRFVGALAALTPHYTILTGDQSIRNNRPISPLLEGLRQLGAFAESSRGDGFAPIIIKGLIKPGHAHLLGEDSQPVSALLIATSFLNAPSQITVSHPGEKPWIDLTLYWLNKLQGGIEHQNYERYNIKGNLNYRGFDQIIPGDFSSAAFPIAAAIVTNSELTIKHLDMEDPQGDKQLIMLLKEMGANIEINDREKSVIVKKGAALKGGCIDVNSMIDAVTILAVLGCFASEPIEIYNGAIARKKESDRIHGIVTELKKMGAKIEEKEDGLIVYPSSLKGACVNTYQDHRMGLSLSVAAMGAKGETMIQNTDCISKSYPQFCDHFQEVGAHIECLF